MRHTSPARCTGTRRAGSLRGFERTRVRGRACRCSRRRGELAVGAAASSIRRDRSPGSSRRGRGRDGRRAIAIARGITVPDPRRAGRARCGPAAPLQAQSRRHAGAVATLVRRHRSSRGPSAAEPDAGPAARSQNGSNGPRPHTARRTLRARANRVGRARPHCRPPRQRTRGAALVVGRGQRSRSRQPLPRRHRRPRPRPRPPRRSCGPSPAPDRAMPSRAGAAAHPRAREGGPLARARHRCRRPHGLRAHRPLSRRRPALFRADGAAVARRRSAGAGLGAARAHLAAARAGRHRLGGRALLRALGCRLQGDRGRARARARGAPRGASTISMQVAKNLFLWPAKSYLRKAIELPLTLGIELLWPKRRILEVYLNVAEWGPGLFGAEAAARHHFGKSAARLGEREAALLAVSLPDPRDRRAGAPGRACRGWRRPFSCACARPATRPPACCRARQGGRRRSPDRRTGAHRRFVIISAPEWLAGASGARKRRRGRPGSRIQSGPRTKARPQSRIGAGPWQYHGRKYRR